MNKQERKLAIRRSVVWSFLVVLAMVVGAVAALVFAGVVDWVSPSVALFTVLGTFCLAATQFSLMLGGGMTKAERNAVEERPEN